jgi:hypothetical protein
MALWPEDLSAISLQEVCQWQTENRAWRKELKLRTATLVNSCLRKSIDRDEYMAGRRIADQDVVECKRRSRLLENEIACRALAEKSSALRTGAGVAL